MANKQTQNLTELTAVDTANDKIPIYDASDTAELKYATPANIVSTATIGALIGGADNATPNDTDFVATSLTAAGILKKITWTNVKAFLKTYFDTLYHSTDIVLAEGQMENGYILPSVASNNLTVALKHIDKDGNLSDPSATKVVRVKIGGVVRSVTSALSIVCNAGESWLNLGSAELATKEADLFTYFVQDTNRGTILGISRFPAANLYSDFGTTDRSGAASGKGFITNAGNNPAAGDVCVNIGRFAATLSAGAGYIWSVPTFTATNLIQRPIYETRNNVLALVATGFSANPTMTLTYKLIGDLCFLNLNGTGDGTSNATSFTIQAPFISSIGIASPASVVNNGAWALGNLIIDAGSNDVQFSNGALGSAFTNSGNKNARASACFII